MFFDRVKHIFISLRLGAPIVLVLAGVLLYGGQLDGPFLFDDESSIVANVDIRQLWPPSWAETRAPGLSPVNNRPLTSLSLACNYALGGLKPSGYRVFNLLVHLLAALALYGVLRISVAQFNVDAAVPVAFCGALIWLVHPLNSQCVYYVTQRSESLMALFYLCALYCTARVALDGGFRWSSAAVCSCALGMLSKEIMLTAPVVIWLYDRIFFSQHLISPFTRRPWLYVGLALTWVIPAVLLSSNPHGAHIGLVGGTEAWNYALNQCVVISGYLYKAVWPQLLTIDYGPARLLQWTDVWPQAVFLLLLLALVALSLWRWPAVGFALAFFFIVLSPTSSFVAINNEVGAERRVYLPLAALAGLVAAGGWFLLVERSAQWKRIGLIAFCAWLMWSARATYQRGEEFASLISIWETAVEAVPDNPRAHAQLGDALVAAGRYAESIHSYRRALAAWPDLGLAHRGLGGALAQMQRHEAAVIHYSAAVKLLPGLAVLHLELARELDQCGRLDEALEHYRRAVELAPREVLLRGELADALLQNRDLAAALAQFQQALTLDLTNAQLFNNAGVCLGSMGRYEEAIVHFRRALQLDESHDKARHNLRAALRVRGDT